MVRNTLYIPVIIDDVKRYGRFQMTRCTYFTIECDTPSSEWTLDVEGQRIPIYMLGLSGIIWKPVGKAELFGSVYLIDELFDAIERNPALFVDVNEVWFPNFLFTPPDNKRGSLYRVSEELFAKAYLFASARIGKKEFVNYCKGVSRTMAIWYSKEETEAFSQWQKTHIEGARQLYHKAPALKLKRKQGLWRDNEE